MKTYRRIDADTLDDAKLYPSMRAAIEAYAETARELDRYGQKCEASLHFARNREELQEYPDRVLSLGPKGGIKVERT
jgi:hypothetical protein